MNKEQETIDKLLVEHNRSIAELNRVLNLVNESSENVRDFLHALLNKDIDLSPDDEALRPSTSPPKEGKEGKPY